MNENRNQAALSDEIDLLELLAKIVITIKGNILSIIIAFVIGSILGLCYYQFVPKTYESQMLISSDILTESYSKALVEDINKLVKEKSFTTISTKLNISEQEASKLGKLGIKNGLEKSDGIKEEDKNYLQINVQSSDNTIWSNLQNGLINFLESNDYAKIRIDQKRKYYVQIIQRIDIELVDLAELKNNISSGKMSQSSKDNLILFDPTTVNTKILELNKEKINLQNELETVNGVQLVEGFTVFEKPVSPKLSISLVAGASVGLFFVALIIAFKSLRKIVRLSEEKLANP
jgi:small basic protein